MVEKEFIEQINAFIAWLEELEAVTIASVEDTKVRMELNTELPIHCYNSYFLSPCRAMH